MFSPISAENLLLFAPSVGGHGPLGVGALYVRRGAPFQPLIVGGNQENRRRGGTYNTVSIVGFGTAVDGVLNNKTWKKYDTEVRELRDVLAKRILAEIPGSSLNTDITPGASLPAPGRALDTLLRAPLFHGQD